MGYRITSDNSNINAYNIPACRQWILAPFFLLFGLYRFPKPHISKTVDLITAPKGRGRGRFAQSSCTI